MRTECRLRVCREGGSVEMSPSVSSAQVRSHFCTYVFFAAPCSPALGFVSVTWVLFWLSHSAAARLMLLPIMSFQAQDLLFFASRMAFTNTLATQICSRHLSVLLFFFELHHQTPSSCTPSTSRPSFKHDLTCHCFVCLVSISDYISFVPDCEDTNTM